MANKLTDIKRPLQRKTASGKVGFLVSQKTEKEQKKIRIPETAKRRRRGKFTSFPADYFSVSGRDRGKSNSEKNSVISLLERLSREEEKICPFVFRKDLEKRPKRESPAEVKKEIAPAKPEQPSFLFTEEDLGLEIDLNDLSEPEEARPEEPSLLPDRKPEEENYPAPEISENFSTKRKIVSETFYASPRTRPSWRFGNVLISFLTANLKARPVFALTAIFLTLAIPVWGVLGQGLKIKDEATGSALAGYHSLILAKRSVEEGDFQKAGEQFSQAREKIGQAQDQVEGFSGVLLSLAGYLPGFNKLSDQNSLLLAAKDISWAGESVSFLMAGNSFKLGEFFNAQGQNSGLTEKLANLKDGLSSALGHLERAKKETDGVSARSLPAALGAGFVEMKTKLDSGVDTLSRLPFLLENLLSILGHERSRKYLVLFQNSSELRATGGFIGSYGILDISRGEIENLFVDNIYNPDGQLKDKIMPPEPIQKISANWSMHDANWFADFPTSARQVASFYEKTGGSTVDGVIALTPGVVEAMLLITGPIELPEYGLRISADNFLAEVQYKVEEDFDREENKPKRILSDLAPILFEKIMEKANREPDRLLLALTRALQEKDLLFYFRDEKLQSFAQEQNWAGQLKQNEGDFLMFVNSNINGYKTDYAIKQEIFQTIRVAQNGEIFHTLKVKRTHLGGDLPYEWWNKVNADYFRVYAPKGSELLAVSGNTQEEIQPPLDYEKENYFIEKEVRNILTSLKKTASGIDVFQESGKTVFGGWLYVSPGEQVELTLQYKSPSVFDFNDFKPDRLSFFFQKQPGMGESVLDVSVEFPQGGRITTSTGQQLKEDTPFFWRGDFSQDKGFGFVIE